ncbi:SCO7613 C-terminal domain-containing membrane protein [Streptomyces sp. NPDC090053]|uniref:SCO7613 C-terminal domain-containing membrane protein n=1 Tax=Streptomyces sp. NPDC090053 TaxID=3365932 RepID=UPI0038027D87
MENVPPPAEELAFLDHELAQLDAHRAQLLARRAWLISVLQSRVPRPQAPPSPAVPRSAWAAPRPETSPPGVQNLLLALGGLLLTIAAIAFTVVSWGHLGIGGRAGVLGVLTSLALVSPVPLLRRGLASTAEALAGLGLALTVLDAYAWHRVSAADTGGAAFAAGAAAVLALLWAGYGSVLGRLGLPLPAAAVAAQLPLPLWSVAVGAGALTTSWALLLTAVVGGAIAWWGKGAAVRLCGCAGAGLTGAGALLTAGLLSFDADTAADAAAPGALLLAAAVLTLFAARRMSSPLPAAVAGLAAVAAVGGVARTLCPDTWEPVVHLLCAVALLAAVRTRLPRPVVRGLTGASAGVQTAVTVWALPPVLLAVVTPLSWAGRSWTGAPRSAELSGAWPWLTATPVALLTVAAVLALARRRSGPERTWRTGAACSALVLGWAALLVLPVAFALPYTATVLLYTALTAACLALAGRPGPGGPEGAAFTASALACALTGALTVTFLALAARPATFTVLGILLALFAVAAAVATGRLVRTVAACAAVAYATGLAGAAGAALELPLHRTSLLVLVVPAAAALLAARLRHHPLALPVEITGAAAGLLAIALSLGDAGTAASVLALCAVIVAGTAVRPERRTVGPAAPVLFVLATWIRLSASGVAVPEAYTLPVAVPALAIGLLRRRRDPQASSWTAYGPGLVAMFAPSLFAVQDDPYWPRPLLLGVSALAVTLTGARLRLQALLVLGGAVLALDALHELAPYIGQLLGALPRWLAPALAGLLLLGVGATYEQRLRDARRLRDRLARMR